MVADSLNPAPTFARLITRWWRTWMQRSTPIVELSQLGTGEFERIAQDGVTELSVLAGKWPDSTELLSRRLSALDERQLHEKEPQVLRDM